jgi:thioesterase domain-containing protein
MKGRVDCYNTLADELNDTVNVYGIQHPFWGYGEFRYKSMIELAKLYVTNIKNKQPHGPYRIAGWSLGGEIAYYITYILQAQGAEIEYLHLFDSNVPKNYFYEKFGDDFKASLIEVTELMAEKTEIPKTRLLSVIENSETEEKAIEGLATLFDENGTSEENMERTLWRNAISSSLNLLRCDRPAVLLNGDINIQLFIASSKADKSEFHAHWQHYSGNSVEAIYCQHEHQDLMIPDSSQHMSTIFKQSYQKIEANNQQQLVTEET